MCDKKAVPRSVVFNITTVVSRCSTNHALPLITTYVLVLLTCQSLPSVHKSRWRTLSSWYSWLKQHEQSKIPCCCLHNIVVTLNHWYWLLFTSLTFTLALHVILQTTSIALNHTELSYLIIIGHLHLIATNFPKLKLKPASILWQKPCTKPDCAKSRKPESVAKSRVRQTI